MEMIKLSQRSALRKRPTSGDKMVLCRSRAEPVHHM
jgi:hypothetical protein